MVDRVDLDGVVIATPWRVHVPMAITAMEAGVTSGIDVGPAASVQECHDLVATVEETGEHCMLLENYCYKRHAMAVLEMVRDGPFGEAVHCQCDYLHHLRSMLDARPRGTAGHNHRKPNGDLYLTHGVGPIAKHPG